jgi:hypothetical protein
MHFMTLQAQHVGTRLLLILAMAAALLVGLVAVGWTVGYSNVAHATMTSLQPHYMGPTPGGDGGGGHHRASSGNYVGGSGYTASQGNFVGGSGNVPDGAAGGDSGGGH